MYICACTHAHIRIPWIYKFVMVRMGCGISHKDANFQINAATTKEKHHRKNMMKSQTNIFSKYCEGNKKKIDIEYTHVVQVPYSKQ